MSTGRSAFARRFPRDERANVLTMFAFLLLPVTGLIGVATDYGRVVSTKAALQAALDATALAMAPNAASLSAGDLSLRANNYFSANFSRPDVATPTIGVSYSTSGAQQIVVTGSVAVKTYFLRLPPIGISSISVSDSSTATWGTAKLQVALVLDNTGSMNEYNKIGALKTASHQLLSQLQNAAQDPGDIDVAIIPFTTDVNIGTSFASQWWLDWSLWSGGAGNASACGSSAFWNGWPCGSGSGASQSSWTGCVTDRAQSYDVQAAAPVDGNAQSYFPADPFPPMNGCPAQIMPLGHNWAAMSALIDQMAANGETNLTIGLVWGWQALSGGAPLNASAPPPGASQIIVFLTDGLNTADRWYNTFLGTGTQADIDARTRLVCSNIKAAHITVFTVQVDTDNESPASALLQQCASDIGKWFLLTNPADLVTTFNQIGTDLTPLHISN